MSGLSLVLLILMNARLRLKSSCFVLVHSWGMPLWYINERLSRCQSFGLAELYIHVLHQIDWCWSSCVWVECLAYASAGIRCHCRFCINQSNHNKLKSAMGTNSEAVVTRMLLLFSLTDQRPPLEYPWWFYCALQISWRASSCRWRKSMMCAIFKIIVMRRV